MKNTTTSTEFYDYTEYDYENITDVNDPSESHAAPCDLRETWTLLRHFAPASYILVFVLALVGNVLVLSVIRRYRQSRHSPCSFSLTDTFLLHLAVSDLLLAITLPFFATAWIKEWVFGVIACKIAGAMFSLNIYCGVLFLACISFDRYLAIVHAINLSWRRKTCHAQLACALIWMACLGLAMVDVYYRDVVLLYGSEQRVCQVVFSQNSAQQWQVGMLLVSLLLGFALPLLIMLYCYARIFRALCHSTSRRQKRRSLRLIVSLVIVFLLSWAPYNALRVTDTLQMLGLVAKTCTLNKVLDVGIRVTESFGLAHCALNPLLYGLVGIKFRRELAHMCKALLGPSGRLGSAGRAYGRASSHKSLSSGDSENTSYFSVMA